MNSAAKAQEAIMMPEITAIIKPKHGMRFRQAMLWQAVIVMQKDDLQDA